MFKLLLKNGGKKINYKPFSISLKYLLEEKKLEHSLDTLIRVFNVKISALQKRNFLNGKAEELKISKPSGKPDELYIFKVKTDENFTTDFFRNHLAGIVSALQNSEVKNIHIFIPSYKIFKKYFDKEEYYYQTFIEGVMLGNYTFDKYKSENKQIKELAVYFYADDERKLSYALSRGKYLMDGVFFARDLQNEPSSELTPQLLSKKISEEAKKLGIKVSVFDEKEIKRRKMNGLIGVGSGSVHPPRFIFLEYNGLQKGKKQSKKRIALVGKGITFDSGGISIKPSSNMWEMKGDMSGAAVVAGTIIAASKTRQKINLLGIIPAAENMPSGSSLKPGDIIITASKKSIEVIDTDAEGRIILADALDFASKQKPDSIIDLATLTGACKVALGDFAAGLFTKDEELSQILYNAGLKTFERVWAMPMWDEYSKLIKSDFADVKNLGDRWGGAITAAKFLEKFVDKNIPWAHIDIAGPAHANNLNNYTKKYMTGFGVRLLFEYLNIITQSE
jgi:leucyl aminopeptidase